MKRVSIKLGMILFASLVISVNMFESCNPASTPVPVSGADSVNIFNTILKTRHNFFILPPQTTPIPPSDADSFKRHFAQKYPQIVQDVWVDKSVIWDKLKDSAVDGFVISPVCYTKDGKDSQGTIFSKDSVSLMITLTKKKTPDPASAYDFNNPCPHFPCP